MGTILHAVIGYFLLLLVVRVLTRRPGGQMTLGDFVLVFLMGGVIILSTVGNDRSLTNCTCGVITVGLLHRIVSYAKTHSPRLGAIIDGTPVVVMKNGEWQQDPADSLSVGRTDLEAAARASGLRSVDEVDYAVVERNGGISIIKKQKSE